MDQATKLRELVHRLKVQEYSSVGKVIPGRCISITSGKGGVGKTNIAANLALALAKRDRKVMIIDADLGMANVDIVLGISPHYNLGHFIRGERTLPEIIIDGPLGIKIIPGVSGLVGMTHLEEHQKRCFFEALEAYQQSYEPDYVLIDTGAGMGENTLAFSLAAPEVLLITTGEPTAMMDAYAMIKALLYYNSTADISLLVNDVPTYAEGERVHRTIQTIADRFLDVDIRFMGVIARDKNMPRAVRSQKPVLLAYPFSEASIDIIKLAQRLAGETGRKQRASMASFFELTSRYFGL